MTTTITISPDLPAAKRCPRPLRILGNLLLGLFVYLGPWLPVIAIIVMIHRTIT